METKNNATLITRELAVRGRSLDREAREVEVVLSTGARRRIEYWDGAIEEEIPLDRASLERINSVGAVLDNHRAYGSVVDALGAVVRGSVRIEGDELVGRLKFARTEKASTAMQMIEDDILRAVSVGYSAQYERVKAKDRDDGGAVDLYRATSWDPHEVSIVTMPADVRAIIRGHVPLDPASSAEERNQESSMSKKMEPTPAADHAVTPDNPPSSEPRATATVDPGEAIARTAALIGRTRALIERNGLDEVSPEDLVAQHKGDETAIRSAILDRLDKRSQATKTHGHVSVEIGGDNGGQRAAIVDGLLHRMEPRAVKLDEQSGRFRRLKLLDIAKLTLEARGISTKHMGDEEIARRATRTLGDGFHSTSDFSGILGDLANKRLRNAYMARQPVWKQFARRVDFNNFNPINVYKISDFPDLDEVSEGGEYQNGTLNESSETYRGAKYGRMVALTWEAILADDLRAFEQGLRGAGQAALRRENKVFYDALTGVTLMGDGVALFDASRGNISAVGGAASISVVSGAVTAMGTQTGDSADGDDYLDLYPSFILCPMAQRVGYQQALGLDPRRAPDAPSNQIPPEFEGISVLPTGHLDVVDPIVSYAIASPDVIDTLEYGYLRGEEGPQVFQEEGFRIDGTAFKVRHTFALKFIEPKAFVKIPAS